MKSLYKVWRTHNWVFDKAERFGEDGLLTTIHCDICGLQRRAIHSNLKESAKIATQNREKRKQLGHSE
jgi:hypothetical protein